MFTRLTTIYPAAPWLTIGGAAALLAGLAWDALLHRLDPTLAAREGVLTLANPGHALSAAGLGLVVLGAGLLLGDRLAQAGGNPGRRRTVIRLSLLAFVALAAVSTALAAWSGAGSGHTHGAAAACSPIETTPHAHDHPLGALAAHSHAIDLASSEDGC